VTDHPHATLARAVWEAVSHGDTRALQRICAPDLVWHASGRGPRSGDYRGLDSALDYLAAIGEDAEQLSSRFEEVLVGDERVAVIFHMNAERLGRVLDTDFILLFRVAGERVAEVWAVACDQHAVDAFWA
jgi:ketosteroid isomerase-like protein